MYSRPRNLAWENNFKEKTSIFYIQIYAQKDVSLFNK